MRGEERVETRLLSAVWPGVVLRTAAARPETGAAGREPAAVLALARRCGRTMFATRRSVRTSLMVAVWRPRRSSAFCSGAGMLVEIATAGAGPAG